MKVQFGSLRGKVGGDGSCSSGRGRGAQSDGFGTSALPFGSDVRRSTPEIHPFEGHEGQMLRDASSCAIVVMTKEA